jgi:hypothetical protein
MNGMMSLSEEEIAGWLMAAETLVPVFFQIFRPAFARFPGADLRYLDVHIEVDSSEHSQWMNEAVQELLKDEISFNRILAGIDIGGRLLLSIPDLLYTRTKRKIF